MTLGRKDFSVTRTDGSADVFGLTGFFRDDDLIGHNGSFSKNQFDSGDREHIAQAVSRLRRDLLSSTDAAGPGDRAQARQDWGLNWPPFRPDIRHSSEGFGDILKHVLMSDDYQRIDHRNGAAAALAADQESPAMKKLTAFTWGYWGWGTHTNEFVDVVDAVERSRSFRPRIFVDIRRPRLPGRSFRKRARSRGIVPDIRIVMFRELPETRRPSGARLQRSTGAARGD